MQPKISFEFFPPKTAEGKSKLLATREQLNRFNPEYFSVTYGAGGSTRDNTRDIVLTLKAAGVDVAPHLSFGADSEQTILGILEEYRAAGINRIVALRGDLPSGMGAVKVVYANQLVKFIRSNFADHFTIEVAAYPEIHPQAKSYADDIHWLGEKFRAGANSAITQYFYNADAYGYFLDQCRTAGIDQAITPGIMPITNYQNLVRFSDGCGAEIPRWIRQKMEALSDDSEAVRSFGEEVVTRLCEQLLSLGATGFHFYTLNQLQATASILDNLGLGSEPASNAPVANLH